MREQWKSKIGFIWAAVGSAVGLGSIWRFPYVVGENGGGAFVLIYLLCLAAVGIPVLLAEIVIGKATALSPKGAFARLGRWGGIGAITIFTGFIVSAFYGVIAGWTLGYLFEALSGRLTDLATPAAAHAFFAAVSTSPIWVLSFHFAFMVVAATLLYFGVQRGIERGNKVLMPLLVLVLVALSARGLSLSGGKGGLSFLFTPDWSTVTPQTILVALGQAFFSLSLGQGTMVTYGSYIKKRESIAAISFPIALFGVVISLLAGMAIFTFVFAVGLPPHGGESLMFETLPLIFASMPGGVVLSVLFFALLCIAALTSQISALEPPISYLIDEKRWSRKKATCTVVTGSFVLGIPLGLSFTPVVTGTIFGMTFFGAAVALCITVLIPLGGLAAVLLVGWRWGIGNALATIREGDGGLLHRLPPLRLYLMVGIKYIAPLIILFVILDAYGIV